jgi:hypothetical protein
MPVLYRVTEEQVLESAGLDAYVVSLREMERFLRKMADFSSSWLFSRCP